MEPQENKPTLDRLFVLDNQGRKKTIYPADVSGFYSRIKPAVFAILILFYLTMPWISIGGNPAILIDISTRNFYLLGRVFNAQDFFLAFFIASGAAFALLLLTALAGRIWCGWLCPQTVFIEGVFRRIERFIEGPAHQRLLLNKAPWSTNKFVKKLIKHILYILIAGLLAHVFLSYFNAASNRVLFPLLAGILYFNFFWFREQFCIVMCPYGRLQSVLQDRDTININYDVNRGEPRGKAKSTDVGDCVDCGRCIAVCPTGIDIRNGLQMECIGCANCVDACNAIMSKLGRPLGLIRYDSLRGLESGQKRLIRPRIVAYFIAGLIGATVATTLWVKHLSFDANLLRIQGIPFTVNQGIIENRFMVHLTNKNNITSTLTIKNISPEPIHVVIPVQAITLAPLQSFQAPIVIDVPLKNYVQDMKAQIQIDDSVSNASKIITGTLIGPF